MRTLIQTGLLLITALAQHKAILYLFNNNEMAVIIGASMLAHEIGHVLVAWYYGYKCKTIFVMPLIGVITKFNEEYKFSPWQTKVVVSLAGPAANLVLVVVGLCLQIAGYERIGGVLSSLNAGLVAVSLLPVPYMDGGYAIGSLIAGGQCRWRGLCVALALGSLALGIGYLLGVSWYLVSTIIGVFFFGLATDVEHYQQLRMSLKQTYALLGVYSVMMVAAWWWQAHLQWWVFYYY